MDPNELPDFQKKQNLLYGDKVNTDTLRKIAGQFLQAGCLADAMDFFHRIDDREQLLSIKERVIQEGDFFLLQRVARLLRTEPSSEELNQLGQKALSLGKQQFALQAFEKAENETMAAPLRAELEKNNPSADDGNEEETEKE